MVEKQTVLCKDDSLGDGKSGRVLRRHVLASVGSLSAVALAGCFDSEEEPEGTPEGDDDDTSEDDSDDSNGVESSIEEFPDGYGPDGIDNRDEVIGTIFSGINNQNVTYTIESRLLGDGESVSEGEKATFKREPEEERSSIEYTEEGEDGNDRSAYTEGSTLYEDGEEIDVGSDSGGVDETSNEIIRMASQLVSRYDFEVSEEREDDILYDAVGLREADGVPFDQEADVSGRFRIRDDGFPTVADIIVQEEGRETILETTLEMSDRGTTTIDR